MFLLGKKYWQIKKTKNRGYGVFAKKEIAKGTIIGDYLGRVIKTAEYDLDLDKNGLYLMYLTDEASIYPDLKKPGPHLLNHACAPNCWIYIYHGHTLFFATRDIKSGEELTISYLLSPKDKTCDPCSHDCVCGSAFCRGTMHMSKGKYAIWQNFQNNVMEKSRVSKFIFGKNLPKLATYPKIKIDNLIYSVINSVRA